MTEQEWLETEEQAKLSVPFRNKSTDRKRRLYACACVRRVWHRLHDERSHAGVEVAERFAERQATKEELAEACRSALTAGSSGFDTEHPHYNEIRFAASSAYCVTRPGSAFDQIAVAVREANVGSGNVDGPEQASLFRCVFGNPFRPVKASPAWQSPTTKDLALAAYQERSLPSGVLDTVRLNVLADALEELGCHEGLVAHLRTPGAHVRGCWAVDVVLGRK